MTLVRRWQVLIAGTAVGAALALVEAANGLSWERSLSAFVIVVGYTAVLAGLQGRSETMATLAGNPVDERWRLISDRAANLTALVGIVVALGGLLLSELAGRDSTQFGIVAAAMGFAYIAGVGWFRWRT
jgi:uncharacterized membrane protein